MGEICTFAFSFYLNLADLKRVSRPLFPNLPKSEIIQGITAKKQEGKYP